MTSHVIKQEWIDFAKLLHQDEQPKLKITEDQYNWFGETMEMIKKNSDYPMPSGTECRKWARSFFAILNGGTEFVKEFLNTWATQSHEEFRVSCFYGNDTMYDLIGYGIQPLFEKL